MFPLIDLLRACAAFLVVVYHVIAIGQWVSFPGGDPWRVFNIGWIGVDFFLVISGFVIALSAQRGYAANPQAFRWPFMLRRLARIVPLYLLTCLLFVAVVERAWLGFAWKVQLTHYLSHLLFIHNFFLGTHGSINGPTWSIALEMQFYVLMVFIMPWLVRQRIWTVAATLFGAAWAWRFGMTLVFVPTVANPQFQVIYTSQLPGTLDQFACGILLAMALVRGNSRLSAWLAPSWRHCVVWLAVGGALFVLAMALFWPRSGFWYSVPMIVFWRSLLSIAFACTLAAAVSAPWQPKSIASKLLKPFLYLGEISYGIYLWHMLVLIMVMRWWHLQGGVLLATVVGITCVFAALSWHWFEKPVMGWVRRGDRLPATP